MSIKKRTDSTMYHCYVIENGMGVRGILSSPSDAPTLPAGWRMIGRATSFNAAAPQWADDPEISPEAIQAGIDVLIESGRTLTDYEVSSDKLLVQRIFAAMWNRGRKTRNKAIK